MKTYAAEQFGLDWLIDDTENIPQTKYVSRDSHTIAPVNVTGGRNDVFVTAIQTSEKGATHVIYTLSTKGNATRYAAPTNYPFSEDDDDEGEDDEGKGEGEDDEGEGEGEDQQLLQLDGKTVQLKDNEFKYNGGLCVLTSIGKDGSIGFKYEEWDDDSNSVWKTTNVSPSDATYEKIKSLIFPKKRGRQPGQGMKPIITKAEGGDTKVKNKRGRPKNIKDDDEDEEDGGKWYYLSKKEEKLFKVIRKHFDEKS